MSAAVDVTKDHEVVTCMLEELDDVSNVQAIGNIAFYNWCKKRLKDLPFIDGDIKMILSK